MRIVFALVMLFSMVNGLRSCALRVRGPLALKRGNNLLVASRTFVVSRSDLSSTATGERKSEVGMSDVFPSIATLDVIGGSSVLLVSPTPDEYSFTSSSSCSSGSIDIESGGGYVSIKRGYDVEEDDVCDDEILYGMRKETRNMQRKLNEKRLNRFIGGRIALRRALRSIEQVECSIDDVESSADNEGIDKCSLVREVGAILADAHGAPDLPIHVHGSISHKDNLGVGIAIIDDAGRVGCDIEHCSNPVAPMLAKRILTESERASLKAIPDQEGTNSLRCCVKSIDEDVMLRFSFKEAIFKAIHPYLARSVDFNEVEVFPKENGEAEIRFRLNTNENSVFMCRAAWYRYQHEDGMEYFITYARSRDQSGNSDPNESKQGQRKRI